VGAVDAQVVAAIDWRLVGAHGALLVSALHVPAGAGCVPQMLGRIWRGRAAPSQAECATPCLRFRLLHAQDGVDCVDIRCERAGLGHSEVEVKLRGDQLAQVADSLAVDLRPDCVRLGAGAQASAW
jgi:hypothetical protein